MDLMVELIQNMPQGRVKERRIFYYYRRKINRAKHFCCFSDIIVTKYNLYKYSEDFFFLVVWILQWTISM